MTIGIVSAVYRNRSPDRIGMAIAVSVSRFPAFALGMVLMQISPVQLGWLPTVGNDSWKHYILPSLTLGAGRRRDHGAFHAIVVRRHPGDDYIRTARAKGLDEGHVVIKHGLAQRADPCRDDDGTAIRIPARRLDRRREGVQLAGPRSPARRRGRHARLPR
jgi:glutathione transport system permease protein